MTHALYFKISEIIKYYIYDLFTVFILFVSHDSCGQYVSVSQEKNNSVGEELEIHFNSSWTTLSHLHLPISTASFLSMRHTLGVWICMSLMWIYMFI